MIKPSVLHIGKEIGARPGELNIQNIYVPFTCLFFRMFPRFSVMHGTP